MNHCLIASAAAFGSFPGCQIAQSTLKLRSSLRACFPSGPAPLNRPFRSIQSASTIAPDFSPHERKRTVAAGPVRNPSLPRVNASASVLLSTSFPCPGPFRSGRWSAESFASVFALTTSPLPNPSCRTRSVYQHCLLMGVFRPRCAALDQNLFVAKVGENLNASRSVPSRLPLVLMGIGMNALLTPRARSADSVRCCLARGCRCSANPASGRQKRKEDQRLISRSQYSKPLGLDCKSIGRTANSSQVRQTWPSVLTFARTDALEQSELGRHCSAKSQPLTITSLSKRTERQRTMGRLGFSEPFVRPICSHH
jgi:hypothetical protein